MMQQLGRTERSLEGGRGTYNPGMDMILEDPRILADPRLWR